MKCKCALRLNEFSTSSSFRAHTNPIEREIAFQDICRWDYFSLKKTSQVYNFVEKKKNSPCYKHSELLSAMNEFWKRYWLHTVRAIWWAKCVWTGQKTLFLAWGDLKNADIVFTDCLCLYWLGIYSIAAFKLKTTALPIPPRNFNCAHVTSRRDFFFFRKRFGKME